MSKEIVYIASEKYRLLGRSYAIVYYNDDDNTFLNAESFQFIREETNDPLIKLLDLNKFVYFENDRQNIWVNTEMTEKNKTFFSGSARENGSFDIVFLEKLRVNVLVNDVLLHIKELFPETWVEVLKDIYNQQVVIKTAVDIVVNMTAEEKLKFLCS